MLKSVSSITNAIGALNFKGTWDANANSPVLTSSVGTKGDYYVVGTAGSTNLNGISNWGVGDLATFNGSVWQRVEGGADLNGVNLSVSGTSTLSGLTASTALALNASKEIVSVTNTGTGDNVLATSPTLVTPILGTPQSGVVTNLTGTASININGTVGATTPNTGAFTTASTTGDLTAAVQVKSTNSASTTEKYVFEKVFDLFKTSTGSPTTLSICDITSSFATGSVFIEVVVTGQFSDFAGLNGSYVSGMLATDTASFDQINRFDGNLVGIIGFTSVSSGVVNVNISSMRISSFNGIAYVRVIGGNASNAANVIPSGISIS
jgi:hypothetical protein